MHGKTLSLFITECNKYTQLHYNDDTYPSEDNEYLNDDVEYYQCSLVTLFICNLKQSYEISKYKHGILHDICQYADGVPHGIYLSTYLFFSKVRKIRYYNKGKLHRSVLNRGIIEGSLSQQYESGLSL